MRQKRSNPKSIATIMSVVGLLLVAICGLAGGWYYQYDHDQNVIHDKNQTISKLKQPHERAIKQLHEKQALANKIVHSEHQNSYNPELDTKTNQLFQAVYNYDQDSYPQRWGNVHQFATAKVVDKLCGPQSAYKKNIASMKQTQMESQLKKCDCSHPTKNVEDQDLLETVIVTYHVKATNLDTGDRIARAVFKLKYNQSTHKFDWIQYVGNLTTP